jgi:hypothetical protein
MEVRKFTYNGKPREVIIFEENETSIKGSDITYLDKEELREEWRQKVKDIDISKLTEEQQKEEYQKMKILMGAFRHFKKSNIK